MNASCRIAVLSLSVLGLAACAGMHEKSDSAFVAPQRAPSIMDNDEAYMAAVERIARRRGIEIVWVNVPRKQLVAQQDDNK
ncbi:hypothetical protein ACFQZQ_14155 [Lysobacter koreensis]|uniref:Lipoprotein n=2 Tax=Lysobacter koreensis TaxID=266122 RepID=A0ABW2YPU5_9GAMM